MSIEIEFSFHSSSSRSTCRDQETLTIQTEITRQRVSQYSEASSRRGSAGVSTENWKKKRNEKEEEEEIQGRFICKQLWQT